MENKFVFDVFMFDEDLTRKLFSVNLAVGVIEIKVQSANCRILFNEPFNSRFREWYRSIGRYLSNSTAFERYPASPAGPIVTNLIQTETREEVCSFRYRYFFPTENYNLGLLFDEKFSPNCNSLSNRRSLKIFVLKLFFSRTHHIIFKLLIA